MSKEATKLTLELYRYESLVFGRCRYLLDPLNGTGVLQENSRYQITSDLEPGIVVKEGEKTKLNVWGSNLAANDQAFFHAFGDPEEAEEFTVNITRLHNRLNGINQDIQSLVKVI